MANEALTSAVASTQTPAFGAWNRLRHGLSLSRIQSVIGTMTGIITIVGAGYSVVQFARPAPDTGELVAVVQDAGTHAGISNATIEVLTLENALVATLTPDAAGRATHDLKEGVYLVRVSHPRYAAESRRIQVQPGKPTEIRASLRTGSSSPIERAVNDGVSALRKKFRF
jgi:hypothetical protein